MDYVFQIMGPLIEGAGVTIQVFLVTLVLSVPLGLCLALCLWPSVQRVRPCSPG